MEDMIRPSADLRNHYSDISKLCRETRQPVVITVNGRGSRFSECLPIRKRMSVQGASLPLRIPFMEFGSSCLREKMYEIPHPPNR